MNSLEIQLFFGLYFLGLAFPGLFTKPVTRTAVFQAIFGAALILLAFFHVSLIR